jgi:hypothetical protein
MLIQIDEVYTIKTNSGDEIITKVLEVNTDHLLVSDPVSVAPGPQGMGLIPSLFTGDTSEKIRLNTNNVVMIVPTEDSVKMKYIEATTGIKVPSKKLILG